MRSFPNYRVVQQGVSFIKLLGLLTGRPHQGTVVRVGVITGVASGIPSGVKIK